METVQLLRVFLASPGDVKAERDLVEKIIGETNRTIGDANGVRVEVTRWETDMRAAWGKDGQAIINDLTEKRAHEAFVVIFWNRFGSPTPRAISGTLEEFKIALKKRLQAKRKGTRPPEIMLYFNDSKAEFRTKKELEQKAAVLDFRAGIKEGLYVSYKGRAAFERKFREDYQKWLLEEIAVLKKPRRTRQPKTPVAPIPKPRTPIKVAPKTSKLQPILLNDDLFFAEKVIESGTTWTLILRPQKADDDQKIRAWSNQNQWHQQFSFAYGLQAGRAQITKPGERSHDEKGDYWKLELRFSPTQPNPYHQVNYQGMDAAQIAQARAKWLLLAEEPATLEPRNSWESPDSHLWRMIKGQIKPILPVIWQKLKGDREQFKAMAQLAVVESLLKEGICDHIDAIVIGTPRATKGKLKVSVEVRGTRQSPMRTGKENISVKGVCPLPHVNQA